MEEGNDFGILIDKGGELAIDLNVVVALARSKEIFED